MTLQNLLKVIDGTEHIKIYSYNSCKLIYEGTAFCVMISDYEVVALYTVGGIMTVEVKGD